MPLFGSTILYLVLVMSAATFAVAVAAGPHPKLLRPARLFAYTTCGLIALDVAILAYCFQTHDFSVRYVQRYSDRSMEWFYLFTALWGGQDGSLLWWTFILSMYTAACVRWLRGRYFGLQPYLIATIMVVIMFFAILMAFAANPFETSWSGAPADGKCLNPLLQNFYMTIHPPSLYTGFVGCTIPFAFAIAALVSGRLKEEWLWACRRWLLFAWLFLSLGNVLGALWAYEELGWGGYWAWDPVENAAFMPWLVATAFLHSVMIQERRGMLKTWNLILPITTFAMTIFGTFLTRSGLISSVHSFAQSGIGVFFVYFLAGVLVICAALLIWRAPLLKSEHRLESFASREAIFLFNNWILLAGMVVILVLTTFPLLTELFSSEKVTVGPNFFTFFMIPIAMVLLVLMGIGTVVPWRKANAVGLVSTLRAPIVAALVAGVLLVAFGGRTHFHPYVRLLPDVIEGMKSAWLRAVLRAVYGVTPVVAAVVLTFSLAVVVQEYWRGTRLRVRNTHEAAPLALVRLVARARRRYAGYIVHAGFIVLIFGIVGSGYKTEKEASLRPGQSMSLWDYHVTFRGLEKKVDPGKRMLFARLAVTRGGHSLGILRPAKFMYRCQPEMPTTEVVIKSSIRDDLYVILGGVDPTTNTVTIKLVINPLTPWIWVGALILLLGTLVAMWPEMGKTPPGALRKTGMTAGAAALMALLLLWPGSASAQQHEAGGTAPLPVGSVQIRGDQERILFGQLLCTCGDCARLPLSTCTCGTADDLRAQIRDRLARGETNAQILEWYEGTFGAEALATPPSRGFLKMVWVLPPVALGFGAATVIFLVKRWRRSPAPPVAAKRELVDGDTYAGKLEQELRDLEDE
jgi:cytochrome c-type biogenesis protein CcmF